MISKYSTFEGEISKRLTLSANSPLALVVYRLTICLKLSKLFKFLFSKNSFNAILTGILELIRFNLGLMFLIISFNNGKWVHPRIKESASLISSKCLRTKGIVSSNLLFSISSTKSLAFTG